MAGRTGFEPVVFAVTGRRFEPAKLTAHGFCCLLIVAKVHGEHKG